MKARILCGVIGILLVVCAGTALAQSESQAVNLTKEAKTILDSAKSKDDYQRAAQKYEEALKIFERVKLDKWTCHCSNQLGDIQFGLGQYQKALEYYEKSLAIMKQVGDVKGEGVTLKNIGQVYNSWGQYQKALEFYEKSLSIMKKVGDLKGEANTLNGIGWVYTFVGQFQKAFVCHEQSLQIYKRLGELRPEAYTLTFLSAVYAQLDRYDEAIKLANESLVIREKMGLPVDGVKNGIAHLYLSIGNMAMAEPLIRETRYPATLGRLALLKSEYSSAVDHHTKYANWAEKTGTVDDLFRSYTGLGRAYEGMENYSKAEKCYEKAMKLTEEIRSGLLPSERKNFYEVKIWGFRRYDPAKGLARVRIKLNHPEASITPCELTKARSFADHLSQTNSIGATNIPSSLIEKEQSLVNQLAALKKQLAKTDPEKAPDKFKNLSKSVKDAKEELNFFVEKLWKDYPAYAAVKYPKPPSLKDSALRPDECAVIFDVSSEGVGVILVRDKAVSKAFYLDLKLSDLERDVTRFREPFEKLRLKDYDPELAKSLYDKLLRPALVDVPNGTPLTIIPDGILAMLPFEALVTGGKASWTKGDYGEYPEGLTFLGDEHPISYYQSITALSLTRAMKTDDKARNQLLVLADPVFDLKDRRAQQSTQTKTTEREKKNNLELMETIEGSGDGSFKFKRLAQTEVLADNLQKIYGSNCLSLTGTKANKSDFLSKIAPKIDQYGSVVFATHGVMSTHVPGLMEPFLALAMVPPGTDGFLKMSDILSLKMNADVVALTACQSGLGKELSGEGVMSMGRAFQYAGAKSVLMSLWEVEEKSAVTLAENFFRYRKDGKTKLESLKLARDDIRNAGYKHPFFWAAFILVGEVN